MVAVLVLVDMGEGVMAGERCGRGDSVTKNAIQEAGTFCYEEQCSVLLPAGRFKHRMSGSVNFEPTPAVRYPLALLASLFTSLAFAQSAQKSADVLVLGIGADQACGCRPKTENADPPYLPRRLPIGHERRGDGPCQRGQQEAAAVHQSIT